MKFQPQLLMRWLNSLLVRRRGDSHHNYKSITGACELKTHEIVSRVIKHSRHFSKPNNQVKPGAFNPEPYSALSVLHISGLSHGEVWELARETLGAQRERHKIYGRADLLVGKLIAQKLKAIRDDKPFERHTSVVGWPQNDDPDQRKADIKAICLELSQDADTNVFILDQPIQNLP